MTQSKSSREGGREVLGVNDKETDADMEKETDKGVWFWERNNGKRDRDGEGEIDEKEGRKRETKEWKEESKRIRRNVRARDWEGEGRRDLFGRKLK